ncbi:annexin B9-like [Tribolium madens]|uniref:annexin B9-like n=1 Tax=Tribolium madens TaxID=41895 RepID=UPI001CF72E12|nr:annexin B9-like [Tribolium madens]
MNHCVCSKLPKHSQIATSPTVTPSKFFLSTEDAQVLHKAMKGSGTDEKAIINVIAKRSLAQRLEIISQFNKLHSKNLVDELKKELSDDFKYLILALLTPREEFYAEELHRAMCGLGTDEDVLIEVLCTLNNSEIVKVRHAYYKLFHQSLENDIKGDTSSYFKQLLIALCGVQRDECCSTNRDEAISEAENLYNAGEKQWGTDESTFTKILTERNYPQLRLIFEEYEKLTGHGIEKAIESEFSGDIKDGLLAIVETVQNKAKFFAKKLHKSMKGLGTNDRDLIRVVVTRSEIDMGEIKAKYQEEYGKSLAEAIKGDTSGDYKKCLLALIGEE